MVSNLFFDGVTVQTSNYNEHKNVVRADLKDRIVGHDLTEWETWFHRVGGANEKALCP